MAKKKGTVQSLHTRQPLSNGLSSLDCELVPILKKFRSDLHTTARGQIKQHSIALRRVDCTG